MEIILEQWFLTFLTLQTEKIKKLCFPAVCFFYILKKRLKKAFYFNYLCKHFFVNKVKTKKHLHFYYIPEFSLYPFFSKTDSFFKSNNHCQSEFQLIIHVNYNKSSCICYFLFLLQYISTKI